MFISAVVKNSSEQERGIFPSLPDTSTFGVNSPQMAQKRNINENLTIWQIKKIGIRLLKYIFVIQFPLMYYLYIFKFFIE